MAIARPRSASRAAHSGCPCFAMNQTQTAAEELGVTDVVLMNQLLATICEGFVNCSPRMRNGELGFNAGGKISVRAGDCICACGSFLPHGSSRALPTLIGSTTGTAQDRFGTPSERNA